MLNILLDKKYQKILGIGILILLISIFTKGFTQFNFMSSNAIAKKGVEFITEQISKQNPNSIIELKTVEKYHGLVKATINVDGEDIELFITQDGKIGFIQPIIMDKELAKKKYPKSDDVDVKLFTMSYCPFGNDAENAIIPVEVLLRNDVEIEPHYVIYSNYPSEELQQDYCWDPQGKYCSMHGLSELRQNVRELCIYKYNKDSFWKYIEMVNTECTNDDIESCWTKPADTLKIDTAKIQTCLKEEGLKLLAEEKALNEQYNVQGSPTILINEEEYEGERTPEAYKSAICSAFNKEPKSCSQELTADVSNVGSGSCE